MSKNGKMEVDILSQREVPIPGADGKLITEVWITYRYGTLPPGSVRILKTDYSDNKRKEIIKRDIEKRLNEKPKKLEL